MAQINRSHPPQNCECKVGEVGDRFGLDGLGAFIHHRYVEENESLREVARAVNVRIIDTVLDNADDEVIGTPEMIYSTLVNDDVDAREEARVRDLLAYKGVNVDALTEAFVSHMTVKTHLNECRRVDTSNQGATDTGEIIRVMDEQVDRSETVIINAIERLIRVGKMGIGDYEVTVTTRVHCHQCARTYSAREIFQNGGCQCGSDEADNSTVAAR